MSVGLWLEGIVVVISTTFPENSLMICLWLGRAEGGWEAWGLLCGSHVLLHASKERRLGLAPGAE